MMLERLVCFEHDSEDRVKMETRDLTWILDERFLSVIMVPAQLTTQLQDQKLLVSELVFNWINTWAQIGEFFPRCNKNSLETY